MPHTASFRAVETDEEKFLPDAGQIPESHLSGMEAASKDFSLSAAVDAGKHILFIIENSFVPIDVRVWSEALAAKDWGYEVTVLCPKGMEYIASFENVNGINIYRHPQFRAKRKNAYIAEYITALFWEFVFCCRIYFKAPFHVIHGANPPDHLFLIAWLFKPFGVKYVFDHHDLAPENYMVKFQRKGLLYRLLHLMEKMNFKAADAVVSTNESYKSIAIQRGKKDSRQVFVVRNGPRLETLYFPKPNPKWKDGFDYLVAYIGVIGIQDQLDVLLRIVDCVVNKRKVKTIKFIVIGMGGKWAEIVRMAEEMNLNDYIEFTGYIPYDQVFEIFATADVCVNPEFKNEFTDKSTMIKIMEYMSFAKPIIQFDIKEGRVTAGEASLYVGENDEMLFADQLIELVQDSIKKKKMGEAGKQRVQNFLQWEIQKKELKKVYGFLFE